MMDWAFAEIGDAELGDVRRVERLGKTLAILGDQMAKSVPDACESWADAAAIYRMWSNSKVSTQAIYESHFRRTVERCGAHEVVLVVQDGSSLDYSSLKHTKGLGYLESAHTRGLMIHTTLATTLGGDVLGLVDMQVWARPLEQLGKTKERRTLPIEQKESYVWLDAWAKAQKKLPPEVALLGIADQEADIFELFAAPRRPGAHLLIRATGDRRVKSPAGLLGKAIRAVPACGTVVVEVSRRLNRAPRQAELAVRCAQLSLLPPQHGVHALLPKEVPMWAVLVEEQGPPAGVEAVRWLLLTTQPVENYNDAVRMIACYRRRWLIEQYFYVLKQGCQVEQLQLEEAESLQRALATYAIVAWRQLHLMTEVRHDPHGNAGELLASYEWQALYAYFYPRLKMPVHPPTKREAIRLIARLGGFLARRGDGEPGVKTIWRGLSDLRGIAAGYRIAAERS